MEEAPYKVRDLIEVLHCSLADPCMNRCVIWWYFGQAEIKKDILSRVVPYEETEIWVRVSGLHDVFVAIFEEPSIRMI